MAIEKKIQVEPGTMMFYFPFGNDLYGGKIDMSKFEGKAPEDITDEEKDDFIRGTLYEALLTLKELGEDTLEKK